MTNLCRCLPYSWPTQTNRYLSSCILVRYWRSTLRRNTRLLKVTEDIGLRVFETVIADNKVHADDRCPNGNMKSRGEGNGRVRLNQLITKMWVLWALPSSRVCCWSVISGSRASTSSSHFVLRQFFSHDTKIKLKNSNKQNLSLNPCSTVSNWKSFCFYNCVIYFPLFIFFYVTSVLFISVFKSICNASWS